jgi:large subunit ribosomal protein L15
MHYKGKKGFTSVSASKELGAVLNLFQLSSLVDGLVAENRAQLVGDRVVVDLKELGFRKLLGGGAISRAVQVKVDQCSEAAEKKLKEAGGELVNLVPTK